jgi:hypothetical protein
MPETAPAGTAQLAETPQPLQSTIRVPSRFGQAGWSTGAVWATLLATSRAPAPP